MAEYLGPEARVICDEVFDSTQTLRVAIDRLMAELEHEAERQQFAITVRERIEHLKSSGYAFGLNELSKAELNASAHAGRLLTDDIKTKLKETLPKFLDAATVAQSAAILDNTRNLRAAIDHIMTQIPNPNAARQFQRVIRLWLLHEKIVMSAGIRLARQLAVNT